MPPQPFCGIGRRLWRRLRCCKRQTKQTRTNPDARCAFNRHCEARNCPANHLPGSMPINCAGTRIISIRIDAAGNDQTDCAELGDCFSFQTVSISSALAAVFFFMSFPQNLSTVHPSFFRCALTSQSLFMFLSILGSQ